MLLYVDNNDEELPITSIEVPDGITVTNDTNIMTYSGEVTFSEPLPADCESITVNIAVDTETAETTILSPFVLEIK